MAWWCGGNKRDKSTAVDDDSTGESALSSTLHVVQDAANSATDTAVGAEQREAIRMEKGEVWGRIKEGDTLWSLSEKYLGDGTKWPSLHSACKKELGPDPLRLLPGTHVTEACVARAQELSRKSGRN